MYEFIGKKGLMYEFDTIKLNSNCPDSEKTGSGPGSCGGSTDNTTSKIPTKVKMTKEERSYNTKIKALQAKIDENNKLISKWGDSHFLTPRTKKRSRSIKC